MVDKFTEDQLEQAIIQELVENENYIYQNGYELHRKETDVLMEKDTIAYLQQRYSDKNLTQNEIQTIINNIKLISANPLYEGNKEVFNLLNSGFNLTREDSSLQNLHVEYIDFDNLENNSYKIVNQYTVKDVRTRRPDLLIFINGIPVCICEFKSAVKEDATIFNAWKQIHNRYKRDIPKLLKYCVLSVITDGANAKIGSIFTPYEFYYAWKKINDHESEKDGIKSLITLLRGALAKDRITKIINDFIYYPDNSTKEQTIVCRYPQFFATHKMFNNIKEHLKPNGDGKGGTYFGATGCGKTYTMLFLSRQLMLRDNETFNNPTVIIIVDRDDLNTQTAELFVASKRYLNDDNVRSIETRQDLKDALANSKSGGVYITTIQKFCEDTGLLSERNNIICISDEAHRTQTNKSAKQVKTEMGFELRYGFSKYLRDSFPNATYVGFSGTPIDETIATFGDIVDKYTMQESCADGITVPIAYEPRLARVIDNEAQAKEIEKYYQECLKEGSTLEQVEQSKRDMSKMSQLLANPERMKKLAKDIVEHYEKLRAEKPDIIQKAMIVCDDRKRAYELWKLIVELRPEWKEQKRSEFETKLSKEELEKLKPLEKIKVVATRDKDDEKELFDALGTDKERKELDKQFKNENSNFQIAIVVDMWITGFDVPSLSVMYIDKPLQKHTLIQTISRVNRTYPGKNRGLVVDYIGIKDDMLAAVKKFGGGNDPVNNIETTLKIFRNELDLLDKLMVDFTKTEQFYMGTPLDRLMCLNEATEYIQTKKETETRFMGISKRMKMAFEIVAPSGEVTDEEYAKAHFYIAIRSIIYKQTLGNAPDAETMNRHVAEMVEKAISCTGVENIVNADEPEELFGEELAKQLEEIKAPISKFHALLKLLKQAIGDYGKGNKIKAMEFDEKLVDFTNNLKDFEIVPELDTPHRWYQDGNNKQLGDFLKDIRVKLTNNTTQRIDLNNIDNEIVTVVKISEEIYDTEFLNNPQNYYKNCIRKLINNPESNPLFESLLILIPEYRTKTRQRGTINDRAAFKSRIDFNHQLELLEAIDNKDFYNLAREIDDLILNISKARQPIKRIKEKILEKLFNKTDISTWINDNTIKNKRKPEEKQISETLNSLISNFIEAPSAKALYLLLKFLKDSLKLKNQRYSLLKSILDCLCAENTESVYKAMINQRNRIRRIGRKVEGKCLGTTALTKGLEFDTVAILDAHNFTCPKNFYVALTRASKKLIIFTKTKTLSFL